MSGDDDKPCGGVVTYDVDGNFIERYGCEVHLFDSAPCAWQMAMYAELQAAKRASEVTP